MYLPKNLNVDKIKTIKMKTELKNLAKSIKTIMLYVLLVSTFTASISCDSDNNGQIFETKINNIMKKTSISLPGGDQWEKVYGFSRAKVIENILPGIKQVYISNTSAFNAKGVIEQPENVGNQVEQVILNMKKVMELAGGNLNDIVETTFYTTSFDFFPEIAHVHQKYFGEVQPATTLIHVSQMASSEMLVEGSARAIIYNDNSAR